MIRHYWPLNFNYKDLPVFVADRAQPVVGLVFAQAQVFPAVFAHFYVALAAKGAPVDDAPEFRPTAPTDSSLIWARGGAPEEARGKTRAHRQVVVERPVTVVMGIIGSGASGAGEPAFLQHFELFMKGAVRKEEKSMLKFGLYHSLPFVIIPNVLSQDD